MTWLRRLLLGTVLAVVLVVGTTAADVWWTARTDDPGPADALVVLGAAQYDGTPSSVFESRLDHAAALYRDGVAPRVITVGGKLAGDQFTEAAAGKAYLVEQGVPADDVTAVEEGSDTLGSVRAVARVMAEQGLGSAVMVSDPWHSLRSRTMARDAGLQAGASPTRSGPAVLTRASQLHGIVRETGALLYYELTHAAAGVFDARSDAPATGR
ncbi:YdcF family protein [Rhodococcus aerolatus]